MSKKITLQKVFLETEKRLKNEISFVRMLAFNDPEIEAMRIETIEFADLLEEFKGKDRLKPEFKRRIDDLSKRADEWRAVKKDPEHDYVKELVEKESELSDVRNSLWRLETYGCV